MKKLGIGILVLGFALTAGATSPKLAPDQLAMNALKDAHKAGKNADLKDAVKDLEKTGKGDWAAIGAVLLSGQCGFAGCGELYLVTVPYSNGRVNTTTATLKALVQANSYLGTSNVQKILEADVIDELLK